MNKAAVPSILIAVVLVAVAVIAKSAAAEESSPDRFSIGGRKSCCVHAFRAICDWLCGSVAGSKDKTSPSNTDLQRGKPIGPLSLRPS